MGERSMAERSIGLVAAASVAVALAVMGIKYVAYLATGSVALYSDALESVVNVIAGVVAFLAVSYSGRPADTHHQFGHHKAEYFSAVLEGVMIVVAALLIISEAAPLLWRPRAIDGAFVGLLVNGSATLINAAWCYFLIRFGKRVRSPALVADGRHIVSDVVTSAGVLLGLVLAQATGWHVLDPLLALIVAVNILWAGWRVIQDSLLGLMDTAVTADILALIGATITRHAGGALQVHDLRTRTAGSATFIELHLVVPGAMTVAAAHGICDRIEMALVAAVPGSQVLIHLEPEDEAKGRDALVV